ncbi:MAG TPA: 5'-nucleotidase C-terminal domain-containing protein, partial [Cellulomonas sp.]|nr:5'-nucleotidase C-terminal domain-containing protein [Cellulomonas sp.]
VWAFVPSSADLPPASEMDVITNAIIYRKAAVERTGASHALGTLSSGNAAFSNAREPIAQAFTPVGGGEPFLVVVNHFKSKGSAGPLPGDADTGDGQGASNASRIAQATALKDWIPTIQGDTKAVALLGDFNSYTQEDPLEVLYDAGYTDAASTLADGQYSYSFSGLSGSLDHVLLNGPALERATGADIWEINAEESIALEYSRYNYHGTLFYAPDEYRSSDHDPVVVGLTASTPPVDLTFLNINDFHGRIDANTVKFAGTVEKLRSQANGPVAFLSAGDNIGASLFASATAQDKPTIDVLNALDLQTSAVGNHEFDKGFADLTGRVADAANWDYLGANVYDKGTTNPALDEYKVIDMDGVRVGVIGVVTQETPTLVTPGGIADLDFGDPVAAVNRVADQLTDGDESNGEADVLVAEYHEGAAAGTPDGASLEQEVAAGGAFADIVNKTSAKVDAIFTGHTHKQYAWEAPVPGEAGTTRPILQTGSYGEFIGKIVLTYDPTDGDVTAHTQVNVARVTTADADLVAAYPRVAEVKSITDAAIAHANEVGSVPVGSVTADITTAFAGGSYVDGKYVGTGPLPSTGRDDRANESTLGNLVANALRDTLAPENLGGAQIGVVNPGGLRDELFYSPDGVITTAEANGVLPFVNNLWTTTLTGAQVITMLEQQWQTNADGTIPSRPYLALGLSDNVSFTYDASAALGHHITSVTVDGHPLDPAADYRIGTFSFLAQGGDNFRVFTSGTDTRDSGLIDRDGWIAYLESHEGLSPDFARHGVGVPALPASVTAGDALAFTVSKLDLTSLGSPRNTSLDVRLDGTSIGSATVSEGDANVAVTIPATTAGDHVLTLVAAPSGTTVTLPIAVEASAPPATATSTTLKVTGGTKAGQSHKLTATVAPKTAAGAVTFLDGTKELATVDVRKGKAQTTVQLKAGEHSLTAVFVPADPSAFAGSTSRAVQVTVALSRSATSLVVKERSVTFGSAAHAVVTVVGTSARPSGQVQIRDGKTLLLTVDLKVSGTTGVA